MSDLVTEFILSAEYLQLAHSSELFYKMRIENLGGCMKNIGRGILLALNTINILMTLNMPGWDFDMSYEQFLNQTGGGLQTNPFYRSNYQFYKQKYLELKNKLFDF